ncbi:MAG: hypothetical protein HPY58_12565 [Firmicutes bacterium]|nr:hypothetical protein [Bacillota bacterium]
MGKGELCPYCYAPALDVDLYCPGCGRKSPLARLCPACENPATLEDRFCYHCDHNLRVANNSN